MGSAKWGLDKKMTKESKLMILAKVIKLKEKLGENFGIPEYEKMMKVIEPIPYSNWEIRKNETGALGEAGYRLSIFCSTRLEDTRVKIDYHYSILKTWVEPSTDFSPAQDAYSSEMEGNISISQGLHSITLRDDGLEKIAKELVKEQDRRVQILKNQRENRIRGSIQKEISQLIAKLK